jgi:hypothetical protein
MESSTAAVRPLTRDETGTLLGQTMGLVAVTAGFCAVGAYLGRDLSYGWAGSSSSPPLRASSASTSRLNGRSKWP